MSNCWRLIRSGALMLGILLGMQTLAFRVVNRPVTLQQPDGKTVSCLMTGDEIAGRYHDAAGYTLCQGQDGYVYYAIQDADGRIAASAFRVDQVKAAATGLKPGICESRKWIDQRLAARPKIQPMNIPLMVQKQAAAKAAAKAKAAAGGPQMAALNVSTFNNIVIYVKFADTSFNTGLLPYEALFNTDAGSQKAYFQDVSNGAVTIDSIM